MPPLLPMLVAMGHLALAGIRAWALRDERARVAVARVDVRRIAYLCELHTAAGAEDPQARAQEEYVTFLGVQQLCAMMAPPDAAFIIGAQR